MIAKAFVKDNVLNVVGLAPSDYGPIPFTVQEKLETETPDGEVDLSTSLPEHVEKAFSATEAQVMSSVNKDKMAMAAEQVVRRARYGDQVAMAIIARTNQNAQMGSEQAKKASKAIFGFIKKNPFSDPFGAEPRALPGPNLKLLENSLSKAVNGGKVDFGPLLSTYLPTMVKHNPMRGVVLLADGDNLLAKAEEYVKHLNPKGFKSYKYGYSHYLESVEKVLSSATQGGLLLDYVRVGYAMGLAMALQAAREGNIAAWSPEVAAELS